MDSTLARAKVIARLHDPAEKALVLLRDPAGHEGGTTRTLLNELFPGGVDAGLERLVRRADRWASAADRPQFPRERDGGPYARWTQVDFTAAPVLIHPLSGEQFDLRRHGGLGDTAIGDVKAQSTRHFKDLIHTDEDGDTDWWRTLLAFWRFGPELGDADALGLGELWRRLPADTRVPDHTIWDHLDLVSAFTGAFTDDEQGRCALLQVSLGPVQDFIAAARTTSDLWAGSHLLSRLSWEAMRVVCEDYGPDAVLFPSLRGVPQVDLWLWQQRVSHDRLENTPWHKGRFSDANPLFSAALPNRMLAIVPAAQAEALAQRIEQTVRGWALETGRRTVSLLLEEAGIGKDEGAHAYRQCEEQLAGFPEVHWSVVGYDELVGANPERDTDLDTSPLAEALAAFYEDADSPGFLGSEAWRVLRRPVELTDPDSGRGATFYRPNPGVLYPAVYALGNRLLAGSKALRRFDAVEQAGYRCSLTGETEWLTHDPAHLRLPPGRREDADTLWTRVSRARPTLARPREHLGALAALKRLWPTLFCEEVSRVLDMEDRPRRFVVSTHTMALVTTLERLAADDAALEQLDASLGEEIRSTGERTALPRRLAAALHRKPSGDLLARLPGWLERQREEGKGDGAELALERVLKTKHGQAIRPETYYALLLMDGDRMGAWLSGDRELALTYEQSFHPTIRECVRQRFQDNGSVRAYLHARRAVSPGRHIAISAALNDFSGVVARQVVEGDFHGRVLYAGGDDLMAMVPTFEVLDVMSALRWAYSGEDQEGGGLHNARGFRRHQGRLHLCMGPKATASVGVVIAHHQTPLAAALEALRAAERRAKDEGNRNAFSITLMKRAGGALHLTDNWQRDHGLPAPMTALKDLATALAGEPGASRRAAYNIHGWLPDLPEPQALGGAEGMRAYLEAMLHQQFYRQGLEKERGRPVHSRRLAALAADETAGKTRKRLAAYLGVAEFLAREARINQ